MASLVILIHALSICQTPTMPYEKIAIKSRENRQFRRECHKRLQILFSITITMRMENGRWLLFIYMCLRCARSCLYSIRNKQKCICELIFIVWRQKSELKVFEKCCLCISQFTICNSLCKHRQHIVNSSLGHSLSFKKNSFWRLLIANVPYTISHLHSCALYTLWSVCLVINNFSFTVSIWLCFFPLDSSFFG